MGKTKLKNRVVDSTKVGSNEIDSDKKIINVSESDLEKDESNNEQSKAPIDSSAADLSKAGLGVVQTVLMACLGKMTNDSSILPFLSFQSVLVWSLCLFRGEVDDKFICLVAMFSLMAFGVVLLRFLEKLIRNKK